jgi:hypothetical protein
MQEKYGVNHPLQNETDSAKRKTNEWCGEGVGF